MRVLHVASTFPRYEGDSIGPYLGDLVDAERAAGLDVRVVVPHAAGLAVEAELYGIGVRRFRYGPAFVERLGYGAGLLAEARSASGALAVPLYMGGMAAAVRSEVRRWRPDLVHAHWWLPGGVAASLAPAPFVVTLHGSDVAIASRPVVRTMARVVLRRARAVVAVSDALAASATSLIGVKVGVAAMPVVVPLQPRPPRRPGPLRLLAVGRLAPEKGFDVLIDALTRMGDFDGTLDILGDGTLMDALQRRAAPLGSHVRFVGAVSRTDYHARLREADVLVVPSRREGLGLVAVEAVLVGTPVIASCVGGLPSVLAGTIVGPAPGGALVAPSDPVGLAAALRDAASLPPPGPAAVAAAARHQPAAVGARHLELYRSALDPGR